MNRELWNQRYDSCVGDLQSEQKTLSVHSSVLRTSWSLKLVGLNKLLVGSDDYLVLWGLDESDDASICMLEHIFLFFSDCKFLEQGFHLFKSFWQRFDAVVESLLLLGQLEIALIAFNLLVNAFLNVSFYLSFCSSCRASRIRALCLKMLAIELMSLKIIIVDHFMTPILIVLTLNFYLGQCSV